ncbi:hypothetical protein KBD69_02390 [Candidatus Woesebacteria bacterium]|nr:hypothetical protein [Candidatus Woesebacteria bacterium]
MGGMQVFGATASRVESGLMVVELEGREEYSHGAQSSWANSRDGQRYAFAMEWVSKGLGHTGIEGIDYHWIALQQLVEDTEQAIILSEANSSSALNSNGWFSMHDRVYRQLDESGVPGLLRTLYLGEPSPLDQVLIHIWGDNRLRM